MDELDRKYTVLLVEDSGPMIWAIRDALTIEPDFEFVGYAIGRAQVEQLAQEHAPDLVLVDMKLPVAGRNQSPLPPEHTFDEGLWTITRLRQISLQSRIIAFSEFFLDNPSLVVRALECGANAVLPKQNAPFERDDWGHWLRQQLHSVARGYWRPDAVVAQLLLRKEEKRTSLQPAEIDSLSARELDVLRHMAQGLKDEEIAARLVIAPTTVRSHIRNVMGKLHARNRTEAVVSALRSGLLHPEENIRPRA